MTTNNTCLLCGEPAKTRGLCQAHYEQFRYQKERAAEKSTALAEQLDEAAVAANLILESRQGKRPDKPQENAFESLLKKLAKRAT